MALQTLQDVVPDYAKDLRLNLAALTSTTKLTEQQLWGVLLACAVASGEEGVLRAIAAEAGEHLDPKALRAAKTAAALMSMNNVYYRFVHMVPERGYAELSPRLRMQGLANHGVDSADFELWCLAVSAIHGCGACAAAHERQVAQKGLSSEAVQDAVRVASVVHALAVTLAAERVLGQGSLETAAF